MACKFDVDKTIKAYKIRLHKHIMEDMIAVSEEMYGKDSAITTKVKEVVNGTINTQLTKIGNSAIGYNGTNDSFFEALYDIQDNITKHEDAHVFFKMGKTELKEGPL